MNKQLTSFMLIVCTISVTYFLQLLVMRKIQATELMWFLYWFQIPFVLMVQFYWNAVRDEDTRKKTIEVMKKAIMEHDVEKLLKALRP